MFSARNLLSRLYRGGLVATNHAASFSSKQDGCSLSLCRLMSTGQPAGILRPSFLLQVSPTLPQCQVRTYKTKGKLKLRCSGCYFEERFGRLYVECKLKPRHKQMQIKTGTALYKDDYSTGKWKDSIHWQWRQRQGFYQRGNTEFARVNWLKGRIGTEV